MATNIRHQLREICGKNGVAMTTAGNEYSEIVRRTLLSGLCCNVAEHIGEGKYQTVCVLTLLSSVTKRPVTYLTVLK